LDIPGPEPHSRQAERATLLGWGVALQPHRERPLKPAGGRSQPGPASHGPQLPSTSPHWV